jgi:hypothetical protein
MAASTHNAGAPASRRDAARPSNITTTGRNSMHTSWIRCVLGASIALAACTLAGCGGMKNGAEAAVRESLKDPDSAQFGQFYFNEKTQKGCMEVNAKNSFGGYGEEQEAFLIHTSEGWTVDDIAHVAHDGCVQNFADKAQ